MAQPIVLLSDFGTTDGYAAAMRGAILTYDQSLAVHDASHNITAFSIHSAAYVLHSILDVYPRGTVFVCVVDPGVGSSRRELIAEIDGRIVVAPDNGLITLCLATAESGACFRAGKEVLAELRELHPPHSTTFDGRDLFAPLGARIARGGLTSVTGEPVDPITVEELAPRYVGSVGPGVTAEAQGPQTLSGSVIHLDSFGNAITNIHLPPGPAGHRPGGETLLGSHRLSLKTAFSDVPVGEPLAYWGSYGFLEIAISQGNAGTTLGVRIGDAVTLETLLDTQG